MRFHLLLGLLMFMCQREACAWGRLGHETVGIIAEKLIKGTNAQAAVAQILAPGETLAMAAEWADCAKGICGARTAEMEEFAARNRRHHAYHYTDVPFQHGEYRTDAAGASKDDIVHVLRDAILVLQAQPASSQDHVLDKRTALFLLAHLLGDIHQPLHVGAAYIDGNRTFYVPTTSANGKHGFTEGGNWLCVGEQGLHGLWDSDFVEKALALEHVANSREFADRLAAGRVANPNVAGDVLGRPQSWATESLRLAKQQLKGITVVARRLQGSRRSCRLPAQLQGMMWTFPYTPRRLSNLLDCCVA